MIDGVLVLVLARRDEGELAFRLFGRQRPALGGDVAG